jgi:hypothetical protein
MLLERALELERLGEDAPTKRSCLGWGIIEPPSAPRGQPSMPSVGGGVYASLT